MQSFCSSCITSWLSTAPPASRQAHHGVSTDVSPPAHLPGSAAGPQIQQCQPFAMGCPMGISHHSLLCLGSSGGTSQQRLPPAGQPEASGEGPAMKGPSNTSLWDQAAHGQGLHRQKHSGAGKPGSSTAMVGKVLPAPETLLHPRLLGLS